ncbi:MAG: hypothetical protein ABIS50_19670 [Luteolibacter sp.]|uniref:hypothetical protein n=1 Tax=Luteolibacter sp. TaxID=1962973 RepID=UPI003265FEDF
MAEILSSTGLARHDATYSEVCSSSVPIENAARSSLGAGASLPTDVVLETML